MCNIATIEVDLDVQGERATGPVWRARTGRNKGLSQVLDSLHFGSDLE